MIYATCIIYVLIVVVIYQFTQDPGHISNFIFSVSEAGESLPGDVFDSNQQSMDLSICWTR